MAEGLDAQVPGSEGGGVCGFGILGLLPACWIRGKRELGLSDLGPEAALPTEEEVMPQPETVHLVPMGWQWEGTSTVLTVGDSWAGLLSFTSMMS